MSGKDNIFKMDGVILEQNRDIFMVELKENQALVECKISGKMRMNKIKIMPGDNVTVELSVYDLSKGRIIYRSK